MSDGLVEKLKDERGLQAGDLVMLEYRSKGKFNGLYLLCLHHLEEQSGDTLPSYETSEIRPPTPCHGTFLPNLRLFGNRFSQIKIFPSTKVYIGAKEIAEALKQGIGGMRNLEFYAKLFE